MICIAAPTAGGCRYCVHSHTATARAKGMTDAEPAVLLSIIAPASKTSRLAQALQVPVDPVFDAAASD